MDHVGSRNMLRPRYPKRSLAVALAVSVVSFAQPAQAFKSAGHNAIEGAAYYELTKTADGAALVCELVSEGYLEMPAGESPDSCGAGTIPSHNNGEFDARFELQISNGGQCFHFMASPIDTSDASKVFVSIAPVPNQMYVAAIPRCQRHLTRLTTLALGDDYRSDRAAIVAEIIHGIIDSYSAAHATRQWPDAGTATSGENSRSRIRWLHTWELNSFPPDAVRGHALHKTSDDRDGQWIRSDSLVCKATLGPRDLVERRCFSREGWAAVDAVEDFLRTVQSIRVDGMGCASPTWKHYVEDHFGAAVEVSTAELRARNQDDGTHFDYVEDYDARCEGQTRFDRKTVQDPRCARSWERVKRAYWFLSAFGEVRGGDAPLGNTAGPGLELERVIGELGDKVADAAGQGSPHLLGTFPQLRPSVGLRLGMNVPLSGSSKAGAEGGVRLTPLSFSFHPAFGIALFSAQFDALRNGEGWSALEAVSPVRLLIPQFWDISWRVDAVPLRLGLEWGQWRWTQGQSSLDNGKFDPLRFSLIVGFPLSTTPY